MNTMRVLWFTNTPSCYTKKGVGYNGGGWISSLEKAIKCKGEIELGICFFSSEARDKVVQNGTTYYPIARLKKTFSYIVHSLFATPESASRYQERMLMPELLDVVRDFNPEVIHIFGSENIYGLISKYISIPVILHIQGVLNPYFNAFLPPFLSWHNYIFQSKNPKYILQNYLEKRVWERNAATERKMFKSIRHFMGRTEWDSRLVKVLNPEANYYCCGEMLRDAFYDTSSRRILPSKALFVSTISSQMYKGFDLVLKTAKMLKDTGLDFEWRIYGWANSSLSERIVGEKAENLNVRQMGVVSAEDLKEALLHCTAYVHPSYIDNSPNSLCEAQILGCACVATNVGGVPSLIKEGVTGYLVPANDPYQMTFVLNELSSDCELNQRIGKAAREVAERRHDKKDIVNRVWEIYNKVLCLSSEK